MLTRTTKVLAHRGFSFAYPENTLAALQGALDIGADGLEFDIHFSKDGEMVVIHDEELDRTTNGSGFVVNHTLAQLKELDAGSWFAPEFASEKIPTLSEVLDLVTRFGKSITLNVEIKSGIMPYPDLELRAYELIEEYGLTAQTIFSSFNHFALQNLKQTYAQARIGILYMEGVVDPWLYATHLQAEALHPFYLSIHQEIVTQSHRRGIAIHPFTIDEESDLHRLESWGVDAIITNRPDRLAVMVREN